MKILIVGNGDSAIHLAKMLSHEEQDVVVMGTDRDVLSNLDSRYNVMTMYGRAISISDLKAAGVAGCDLFIAVTPYENHNIVSAQMAKWLGARTTLARIDNGELLDADAKEHFKTLGIDKMVYPELLAAKEIDASLAHSGLRSLYSLSNGEICVFCLKIEENAPIDGMSLVEFGKTTGNFHVSLIKRNGDSIIPGGSYSIEKNDVVYFTALPGNERELTELCGKRMMRIGKVMISGAGKMSETLVPMLSPKYGVTVIDPDRERCLRLSAMAPSATVVNADARDIDVLREEGIRDDCAFVALGDTSEKNIVCAIVAKDLGAVKTIAQIEDIQYFDEAQNLDIDVVVNKKLLTSSRIYQILLDSYLDSPRCLAFEDTEIVEIVVCESSYITRRDVRDLDLSDDMTIAGLTREGKGMLVKGSSRICAGDHVIVFCRRGSLKKVEKLFK